MAKKNCDLRVRVTEEMRAMMDAAISRSIYKLSASQIIERGIVLALAELNRTKAGGRRALNKMDP